MHINLKKYYFKNAFILLMVASLNYQENSKAVNIPSLPSETQVNKVVPEDVSKMYLSFSPIVKKTLPAVVSVSAIQLVDTTRVHPFMADPFFSQFFFGQNPLFGQSIRPEFSRGSGVIISPKGLIVTCHHVIDNAKKISVRLNDGREYEATLLIADSRNDLALLKIKDLEKDEPVPFLNLGNPNKLEVGDLALAIGYPFGVGESITQGIISALRRVIDGRAHIQTDAAINPGNSGGPLVDMNGNVVGICRMIFSKSGASHSVGFAVPSDRIRSLIYSHETGITPKRAWTGLNIQTLTDDLAKTIANHHLKGVIINQVNEKSNAAKAGIKKGDIIIGVENFPILSDMEFKAHFDGFLVGDTIILKIIRPDMKDPQSIKTPLSVSFALQPIPPELESKTLTLQGEHILGGIIVAQASEDIIDQYELPKTAVQGVVILDISAQSPARNIGLEKGDCILNLNGDKIETLEDLTQTLSKMKDNRFSLILNRKGQQISMRMNM